MLQTRLAHLSTSIRTANLDALALNPGPSLVYLTGLHFHLMERPTVAFFTAQTKGPAFRDQCFSIWGGPGRMGPGFPGSRPVIEVGR
jgi:hypothetical protein